jgi:hypothetical protein
MIYGVIYSCYEILGMYVLGMYVHVIVMIGFKNKVCIELDRHISRNHDALHLYFIMMLFYH